MYKFPLLAVVLTALLAVAVSPAAAHTRSTTVKLPAEFALPNDAVLGPDGDGVLLADLRVTGNGYYRIELLDQRQQTHRASAEYRIDARGLGTDCRMSLDGAAMAGR